jgi:hypothetical protein
MKLSPKKTKIIYKKMGLDAYAKYDKADVQK